MKLIISESQLKNITQKVISEQPNWESQFNSNLDIRNPFKNMINRQKEAARPLNSGEGVYLKDKGWWSGTPLEKWMNKTEGLKHYDNNPMGDVYITVENEDWNFSSDGKYATTPAGTNDITETGTWKYDANGNVIITKNNGYTYNSGTYQWTSNENITANCADSLEDIKDGSLKILKIGCKTDAVKELQKLLGMEEKYQTGYFGKITKGKVIAYQQSKNLNADGIVGPKTYSQLSANPVGAPAAEPTPAQAQASGTTINNYTKEAPAPLNEGEFIRIKNLMRVIK